MSYAEALTGPVFQRKPAFPHEVYLPGPDLVRVVDIALALGRPLLLQGEPGCGKTRLAHHVAYRMGFDLEVATVKSTSRAQDLLYTYDAVRRLFDAELGASGPVNKKGEPLARSAANYVEFRALGRAIRRSGGDRRSVVLIDEIDKADLDFPNDLLQELDRMEFQVPEISETWFRAEAERPFVIITHNEEKPLPPAFLRRCVYHYVEFPSAEQAEAILRAHGLPGELTGPAIHVVERLRELDLNKKPGLAELIDWVRYQEISGADPAALAAVPDIEALLKDRTDQTRVRRNPPAS